jgi:predicted pyridoxine 5'-phosphate oxidase superfamily flavin-nucleotide-binding protein
MSRLPNSICQAWEDREGPSVFATADQKGVPNAIYVTSIKLSADGKIVVANNFFQKTAANISSGSRGAVLFITKGGKSYQLKGSIEYFESGAVYEDMRKWADPQYPRVGAAVLNVDEAYSGSEKIL